MRRVSIPPIDVDHDVLETQGRDVVDERIVLRFRRLPTPLPLARRGEGVPFHLGIGGVVSQNRGHAVVEQVLVQAVGGVVQVPLVRADEPRRDLEGLAGSEIRLEVVAIARLERGPAGRAIARDRDAADAPLPADVDAREAAVVHGNEGNEQPVALGDGEHFPIAGDQRLVIDARLVGSARVVLDVRYADVFTTRYEMNVEALLLVDRDRLAGLVDDEHGMTHRARPFMGVPDGLQLHGGIGADKGDRDLHAIVLLDRGVSVAPLRRDLGSRDIDPANQGDRGTRRGPIPAVRPPKFVEGERPIGADAHGQPRVGRVQRPAQR